VGTVKARLVRGRRLMRERLDRRGASLGAGLLLWLLNPSPAAAVPESLLESTLRVMTLGARAVERRSKPSLLARCGWPRRRWVWQLA
jgi:hypothetical protein